MNMRKRRQRQNGKTEQVRLELCDLCGAAFAESEAVRGHVPDSSSVNCDNDWFDGLRLITTCGEPHFAVMRDVYRRAARSRTRNCGRPRSPGR